MDKSVITRVVTVAGGRFAPGHLGELTQQVPFEMVDAALEETCRLQRRVRDLSALPLELDDDQGGSAGAAWCGAPGPDRE